MFLRPCKKLEWWYLWTISWGIFITPLKNTYHISLTLFSAVLVLTFQTNVFHCVPMALFYGSLCYTFEFPLKNLPANCLLLKVIVIQSLLFLILFFLAFSLCVSAKATAAGDRLSPLSQPVSFVREKLSV